MHSEDLLPGFDSSLPLKILILPKPEQDGLSLTGIHESPLPGEKNFHHVTAVFDPGNLPASAIYYWRYNLQLVEL